MWAGRIFVDVSVTVAPFMIIVQIRGSTDEAETGREQVKIIHLNPSVAFGQAFR
jgi:hypothetical protein